VEEEPTNMVEVIREFGKQMTNAVSEAIYQTRASEPPVSDRSSEPKANPPAEFDGRSRRKLEPFLAECEILFATSPQKYRLDSTKILAAGSYLKGDPKGWFANFFVLPDDLRPDWFSTWDDFKAELRHSWGLEDPEGAAEAELQRLNMTDKDHVSYFTSKFRAIQFRLPHWSDRNLRNAFYAALAPRIRAQFVTAGRIPPRTLRELITDAEAFDRAYWADYELNQSFRPANDDKKGSEQKSSSEQKSQSYGKKKKFRIGNISTSASNAGPSQSNETSNASSSANSSSTTVPAYKKLLGPDGKLTPEERSRRLANGLCLFCGQGKHLSADCPKRKKKEASTPALACATITISPSSPAANLPSYSSAN